MDVFAPCGNAFRRRLAFIVDLFNPVYIALDPIFARCSGLLTPDMWRGLVRDALPYALSGCTMIPSKFGDRIGDYAALALAKRAAKSSVHF